MPAQRLLTVVNIDQPEKVEELSRELWMRIWSRVSNVYITLTGLVLKHGTLEYLNPEHKITKTQNA